MTLHPFTPGQDERILRALSPLTENGIRFSIHICRIDPRTKGCARAVAHAIGVDPQRLVRTLVLCLDTAELVSALVPATARLAPKRLAAALGAANAKLAAPGEAQSATGYELGGISPLGQLTAMRTALDQQLIDHPRVYISGGRPGFVVGVKPGVLLELCDALVAPIAHRQI